MALISGEEYGKAAYEAYMSHPSRNSALATTKWENLTHQSKIKWIRAAHAVLRRLAGELRTEDSGPEPRTPGR